MGSSCKPQAWLSRQRLPRTSHSAYVAIRSPVLFLSAVCFVSAIILSSFFRFILALLFPSCLFSVASSINLCCLFCVTTSPSILFSLALTLQPHVFPFWFLSKPSEMGLANPLSCLGFLPDCAPLPSLLFPLVLPPFTPIFTTF